ncbi:MAG TPA: FlgD immunoglobulin-like domain containing protein, partial [Candidatus Polarisedimenticolaceae bacterium]|nr:FlgD immunoglobulin-like domain containing protein [Candidatus Polarisedimenticolaceae bacterium]
LAQQLADVLVLSFGGTTDASNDLPRRRSMTARPNPSSGLTHFSFSLASRGRARLGVYDLLGRRVATLVDADLPGGVHAAVWNGRDATGARVPSGVYLADLQAGGERRTCRIVRVR